MKLTLSRQEEVRSFVDLILKNAVERHKAIHSTLADRGLPIELVREVLKMVV